MLKELHKEPLYWKWKQTAVSSVCSKQSLTPCISALQTSVSNAASIKTNLAHIPNRYIYLLVQYDTRIIYITCIIKYAKDNGILMHEINTIFKSVYFY